MSMILEPLEPNSLYLRTAIFDAKDPTTDREVECSVSGSSLILYVRENGKTLAGFKLSGESIVREALSMVPA